MVMNLPANNLPFGKRTRLYQNLYIPYTPTGNSIIEHTHSFLKACITKLICNHQVDRNGRVHIATMAYNVFPHSSSGESPFYPMFGCDPFMMTLFKLLLPKLSYMGEE